VFLGFLIERDILSLPGNIFGSFKLRSQVLLLCYVKGSLKCFRLSSDREQSHNLTKRESREVLWSRKYGKFLGKPEKALNSGGESFLMYLIGYLSNRKKNTLRIRTRFASRNSTALLADCHSCSGDHTYWQG
jgi:hypothetical protein